jgi:divalent metal cation (Fe/Co/Zn/Cd) transporter
MIGKASIDLTKKSIRDLADQSLPEAELQTIRGILESFTEVKGYHKLRSRKSGDQREIDIHINMEKNTTLEHAHDLCFKIENTIKGIYPGSYIVLHVEPDHSASKNNK